jgi:hypothetical protein
MKRRKGMERGVKANTETIELLPYFGGIVLEKRCSIGLQ